MAAIEPFVRTQNMLLLTLATGQHKDDGAKPDLARFEAAGKTEVVLFVGEAQEKASVHQTEMGRTPDGRTHP